MSTATLGSNRQNILVPVRAGKVFERAHFDQATDGALEFGGLRALRVEFFRGTRGADDKLGAVVKIKANKKGAGSLTIEFASLDQLDGLIGKLRA